MSANLAEARVRARRLLRAALRAAPRVVKNYELECSAAAVRAAVRDRFRRHVEVADPAVIDVLCFKGEHELQETLSMWKTKAHIQKFVDHQTPRRSTFADDFYKAHVVDEWSWPPRRPVDPALRRVWEGRSAAIARQ